MDKRAPSIDEWMREAKRDADASRCGMYLVHNGVVRETPKAEVRQMETDGVPAGEKVGGMVFSYDSEKVESAIASAKALPGIFYIRVWLNEGRLDVGDDIMMVLIGGDIRPHVIDALQRLVGTIKNTCVSEIESPV